MEKIGLVLFSLPALYLNLLVGSNEIFQQRRGEG